MNHEYIVFGKPEITNSDIDAVTGTLKTGWISTGPRVTEFENAIRKYIGCRYTVAVNSCTAGLFLSLLCNGVGKGDEVIVPSMTFCATANVVEHLGAKPVFVDIEDDSYCMDPESFRNAITEKTKVVIPVHFGGVPCNMNLISKYAKEHNITVIEDSAHALGTTYNGRKIGSANTCCFSFYPTKNITTVEGGIVATDDDELAEKIKIYSNHGLNNDAWKRYSKISPDKYGVIFPGYKFNMTDISASLGLSQLKRLDTNIAIRRKYAYIYRDKLSKLNLTLPSFSRDEESSWHLFPILVEKRDYFRKLLHIADIGSGIHYEAVHLQPYYKKYKCSLSRTEYVSERTVSLPIQASMSNEDVNYVCDKIEAILEVI